MKNLFLVPAAALALVAGASAQVTVAQKIGIVDMQSAMVSTKEGQKAVNDLRTKFGPKDQEMQKRASDLQAKQEQFRKTQATMSDEAKGRAQRDIESLGRQLERDQEDVKQDMDVDQQKATQMLGEKLMKVITKYAQDHQFALIFDVSGQPSNILSASNALEITREIIAEYDKAEGANVSAAAPPATKPAAPKPAATTPVPAAAPK